MKKLALILALLFASTAFADDVKDADLAGSWYPGDRTELKNMLEGYLNSANPGKVNGDIFAIISPHAGYQFSAPVAAYGFKLAQSRDIKTVIIIGFSHRKFFDGISVYDRGVWRTPLGDIAIDEKLAKSIISEDPRIRFEPDLFKEENSVEMQIPFVQASFKDVRIVPIAFGTQKYEDAEILAGALTDVLNKRKDVLVVASTDLSHYHPYEEAVSIDKHLITTLNKLKGKELYDEAGMGLCELCGLMPVTTTLLAAEKMGYDSIEILKYANSGDTSGNKGNVVGYLSAAVYKKSFQPSAVSFQQKEKNKEQSMLNDAQRKRLLSIARESITDFVKNQTRKKFTEADPILNKELGAFVTLHEKGELRGCIGNMVGRGPLYQTIADMAIEAATGDPRFQTLSPKEIDNIDIEISVLSPLRKVSSFTEVKIPGQGVLVKKGFSSGVYLPQVATETGWNRDQFLTSLCAHKAGLSPDAWKDPDTEIYVFEAEVFGEKE